LDIPIWWTGEIVHLTVTALRGRSFIAPVSHRNASSLASVLVGGDQAPAPLGAFAVVLQANVCLHLLAFHAVFLGEGSAGQAEPEQDMQSADYKSHGATRTWLS
jgi:hypothetical protein